MALSQRQCAGIHHTKTLSDAEEGLPPVIRDHLCELYKYHAAREVARIVMTEACLARDLCDKDVDVESILEDAEEDDPEEYAIALELLSNRRLMRALCDNAHDILLSQTCLSTAVNKITEEELSREEKSVTARNHMRKGKIGRPSTRSREKTMESTRIARLAQAENRIAGEYIRIGSRDWTLEEVWHFTVLCAHRDNRKSNNHFWHHKLAAAMNERFPDAAHPFTPQHSHALAEKLRNDFAV